MSYKDIDFENDCIAWVCHFGKDMRNRYITDGFFKTANLIYESVKDNNKSGIYEDDLIYPFLHLIRHAYELRLKMIMDDIKVFGESFNVEGIENERFEKCKYSHDIGEIFCFVKDNIYKIDNRLELIIKDCLDTIENCIIDFLPEKDVDPYRYATDRDGNENLLGLNQVSFDKAIAESNDFMNASDYILFSLSKLFDEYSLGTHFKNLSRYDIYQIAIELPKYDKWREPSFDTIKDNLKEKYHISGNTLTEAIKIIQNSRELSFYIAYNRKDFTREFELLKKCYDFTFDIKAMESEEISINKITDRFEEIKEYGLKCHTFIQSLSSEGIVLILAYYFMGHELKFSEQFEECVETARNCKDPSNDYALISYFRSKLTGSGFIGHTLEGIRRSGDFELFIKLYDYCNSMNYLDLSEWKQEYDRLKEYL